MAPRYCVPCDKLSDDPVCPHCGRTTEPVNQDENEPEHYVAGSEYNGIPQVYVGEGQYR